MNLKELKKKNPKLFYDQDWYEDEPWFTEEISQVRPVKLVKDSFSKTYEEQIKLLKPGEEVPSAPEVIAYMIDHYKKTGKRLFEDYYVRISNVSSDGHRVDVGDFDLPGLYVYYGWDDVRDGSVGLASVRNSKNLEPRKIESLIINGVKYVPE